MDDVPLSAGLAAIPLWEWISIIIFLVLSAYFSSSETALTSLPFTKAKQILETRKKRDTILHLWLHKPHRVLTTILIGNNLVNIAASALATDIANTVFHNKGVAVAIGVMTLVILVFGEITPKTFAKQHAESLALFFSKTLIVAYYLFFPVTMVFVRFIKSVVKISGGDIQKGGPFVKLEDIEFLIELGNQEGVLETEKKDMLTGIFEIADTVVREIMIPRTDMIMVNHKASFGEILDTAVRAGHSRIPVYRDRVDNIAGLIYAKDLLKHMQNGGKGFKINDYLRPPYYVPETKRISELLKEFKDQRMHMAIVVDEYGGTAGLITLEDILEEIVGEIQDEYDTEEKEVKLIEDNMLLVDAKIDLEKLESYLGMEIPVDEEYETLGGYIFSHMGRIPKKGESFNSNGLHMQIEEANPRRIIKVKIRKLSREEEPEEERGGG